MRSVVIWESLSGQMIHFSTKVKQFTGSGLRAFTACTMDFDPLAQQQSDRIFQLAARYCPGTPATASRFSNGAFTYVIESHSRMDYASWFDLLSLGRVIARREKVEDEVAIMEYVAKHTEIPVPKVLGSGNCVVGPYIVMDFIDGNPLSEYLRDPSQGIATLSPSISLSVLKRAYFGMAETLLELSKPEFPFIGAIRREELGNWVVQKRPLTFNMNRLAQFSNIPFHVFERRRFNNAADYFEELACQHLHHFEFQRNDAATDEADCRKKYIARCLFRKLSREISQEHCKGPFRLYCDDLCPDNVLIGPNLVVAGVVDWEFTYAALVEFTYAAAWWLLLERPEDWEPDLDQFFSRFMPSSMFDEIYWNYIDQIFFGSSTTLEDRLHLLSAEEQERIGIVVREKMKQASEGKLDTHYTIDELVGL
ncbi:phosphotransferase family protein [Aspergillus novofumigatus IBT 16806]|uniref:Phosphotransferase enzyme family protein n=1 Tax=Aspergillus novofumigatus (strain IBT 16806) TaxID=1392255 RepID=A0A2I1CI06_ASPN1|nr:phosphotransferase enzyme family protein [Aspergillus novofumigatus IBT 16806]PKX97258.1 phosphotransferase enzyme family protein [Aspergillus novofumigatus IBT 16806]